MDVNRISEMENHLDECTSAAAALARQLDRMEALGDGMTRLFGYYGSPEWYEDRDGELPEGVRAGVLSEDLVYDLISEVRDIAIRMIELSADILKNRI